MCCFGFFNNYCGSVIRNVFHISTFSHTILTYSTLFVKRTCVMSSPYNYTQKNSENQMKFWVLTEFAESLRGMDSSFSSFGVQQTLLFLHWKIAGHRGFAEALSCQHSGQDLSHSSEG